MDQKVERWVSVGHDTEFRDQRQSPQPKETMRQGTTETAFWRSPMAEPKCMTATDRGGRRVGERNQSDFSESE